MQVLWFLLTNIISVGSGGKEAWNTVSVDIVGQV